MTMPAAARKSADAFRTISEAAEWLEVPQHVLRFWETKFGALKPLKRGGGRRYYRPDDIDLLRGIRALLYSDGLTIKGVQKIFKEQGARYVMEVGRGGASLIPAMRVVAAEPAAIAADAGNAEAVAGWAEAPADDQDLINEPEPSRGLTQSEQARFTALLDELTELKSRLGAARRRPSFSS